MLRFFSSLPELLVVNRPGMVGLFMEHGPIYFCPCFRGSETHKTADILIDPSVLCPAAMFVG